MNSRLSCVVLKRDLAERVSTFASQHMPQERQTLRCIVVNERTDFLRGVRETVSVCRGEDGRVCVCAAYPCAWFFKNLAEAARLKAVESLELRGSEGCRG